MPFALRPLPFAFAQVVCGWCNPECSSRHVDSISDAEYTWLKNISKAGGPNVHVVSFIINIFGHAEELFPITAPFPRPLEFVFYPLQHIHQQHAERLVDHLFSVVTDRSVAFTRDSHVNLPTSGPWVKCEGYGTGYTVRICCGLTAAPLVGFRSLISRLPSKINSLMQQFTIYLLTINLPGFRVGTRRSSNSPGSRTASGPPMSAIWRTATSMVSVFKLAHRHPQQQPRTFVSHPQRVCFPYDGFSADWGTIIPGDCCECTNLNLGDFGLGGSVLQQRKRRVVSVSDRAS